MPLFRILIVPKQIFWTAVLKFLGILRDPKGDPLVLANKAFNVFPLKRRGTVMCRALFLEYLRKALGR